MRELFHVTASSSNRKLPTANTQHPTFNFQVSNFNFQEPTNRGKETFPLRTRAKTTSGFDLPEFLFVILILIVVPIPPILPSSQQICGSHMD